MPIEGVSKSHQRRLANSKKEREIAEAWMNKHGLSRSQGHVLHFLDLKKEYADFSINDGDGKTIIRIRVTKPGGEIAILCDKRTNTQNA